MKNSHMRPLEIADEDAALRLIVEGTAKETGDRFFSSLVKTLSQAMQTRSAWITEYIEEKRQLRALAFWADGQLLPPFEIPIEGTPCERVIESASLIHYPENILHVFPNNSALREFKAVSYMGIPLIDCSGKTIGNMAVLDTRPLPEEPRALAVFEIFSGRASAELQRIRSEAEIRRREEKYRRIIETTGEGFLLLDERLSIIDVNHAFTRLVGYPTPEILGKSIIEFTGNRTGRFIQDNKTTLFEGDIKEFEGEFIHRNGRSIPVYVYGNTLHGDSGEMLGYMNFIVDMTEHKRSLILAGEVQKVLLPQDVPSIKGYDMAGKISSCEEVGGDYFDFIQMSDCQSDSLDIMVGDVSGHGVDAALVMTSARALLRMRAAQCGTISQILAEMNRHFSRDLQPTGIFMTLFFTRILHAEKTIRWVRAGHLPAVVYDPSTDRFSELKGEGMALGIDPDFRFKEYETTLRSGQVIAIGTDGIIEARDFAGTVYGHDRLLEQIRTSAHRSANEIIDAVFRDVERFSAGGRQEDDMTLLVLKVEDQTVHIEDWQI